MQNLLTIALFVSALVACSQQDVVNSTGAAAKNWCKTSPTCTVTDDNPASR